MKPTFTHLISLIALLLTVTITHPVMATERITYYHPDPLGSPLAATDQNGDILWQEAYVPYGDKLIERPPSRANARGYTGHAHDASGLVYMGKRYYDPIIGRFRSFDPQGFNEANPQTFNRYAYANNNPYKFVDPDGEAVVPVIAGWYAVGAAIGGSMNAAFQYGMTGSVDWGVNGVLGAAAESAPFGIFAGAMARRSTGLGLGSVTKKATEITKKSRRPSAETRRQADKAAIDAQGNVRCQYCGKKVTDKAGSPNSKELDHVTPYSRGGNSTIDNIKTSCRTCNRSKGARTPEEWGGPK